MSTKIPNYFGKNQIEESKQYFAATLFFEIKRIRIKLITMFLLLRRSPGYFAGNWGQQSGRIRELVF